MIVAADEILPTSGLLQFAAVRYQNALRLHRSLLTCEQESRFLQGLVPLHTLPPRGTGPAQAVAGTG